MAKGSSSKIKGNSNTIDVDDALLNNVSILVQGDNNHIRIGKGTKVTNVQIKIYGSGHTLIIGENCKIKSGTFWFEDESCFISVGDKTTIEDAEIAVTEPDSSITLGDDCMLSAGIDIRNGDSHSILDLQTNQRVNFAKDIFIGNHVWIGAGVQVLKGVNIGSNSIIGTRSLVTKSVPENSVATGLPAKVIKENVTWSRERIYE